VKHYFRFGLKLIFISVFLLYYADRNTIALYVKNERNIFLNLVLIYAYVEKFSIYMLQYDGKYFHLLTLINWPCAPLRYANGQFIVAVEFHSNGLDKCRSRSTYQGRWSRLRFSTWEGNKKQFPSHVCDSRGSTATNPAVKE